jgi:hypothetical protein
MAPRFEAAAEAAGNEDCESRAKISFFAQMPTIPRRLVALAQTSEVSGGKWNAELSILERNIRGLAMNGVSRPENRGHTFLLIYGRNYSMSLKLFVR